jgi:hypothetical protein
VTKGSRDVAYAKLARVKHQQAQNHAQAAQLLVEEASLYDELANGESVGVRTTTLPSQARAKYRPLIVPQNVTPEESANTERYLRDAEIASRVKR